MSLQCVIVDDNDHFLDAARTLLQQQGITVVGIASTSHDALTKINDLRPDVVLVDIDLGHDSGFDLVRRLTQRQGPQHPQLRVILISAYAESDFADMIAASPALAFLSKSDISARAIHHLLQTTHRRGPQQPQTGH